MSLLPQQIPPPTEPLVSKNQDGSLIISKNWYLFLYNIALNSLGINGALPAAALQILEATSITAAGTESAQLPRQIANLAELVALAPPPPAVALRDFANVLIGLVQPSLVPAAPQAQPAQGITPGASPYVYTAPASGVVLVTGGTVSALSITRQGIGVATGLLAGLIPLSRGDSLTVTYSVVPTMTFLPA